ncbi:NPCBM/NEW2 domain-containing protein [Paenibacillus sp. GCM10023248]|uniref:NPCBM/NEW2 domain-containing protein n=1 Tax=unclassified Paenibacillus TaxID=185978 RepID=UPI0023794BB3|nr:NPCBM/NEW2 domain-containing protein [Paenibacillus sp. MAHUQ-63]MDD9269350.1 NPCBM/NEW2 domain-containing protein [Paenibacillus sp. MAHUQ-63]
MRRAWLIVTLLIMVSMYFFTPSIPAEASENGLAKTPPMGWNTWNKFGCNVSESLVKEMADAMVSSGMKDAGYQYVNIDDCWQTSRDATTGKIVVDPVRFPNGMKALADYIHSKGLKLGLYTDVGYKTCAGRPGSRGYYDIDAQTYAEWGVDYVKVDWCYVDPDAKLLNSGPKPNAATWYGEFGKALNNSGRGIVYSICNWGEQSPWEWGPQIGNLWRTGQDIGDAWEKGTNWYNGIINAYDTAVTHNTSAGPGGWNDPDMLEIGNGGATTEEYRSQFSLWSMLASPLIAGNDLRSMSQATKDILMNKEVIAVNQDPLGVQAAKIIDNGDTEVLVKPLANGDKAVALLNRGAQATKIRLTAADIGLPSSEGYLVRDLWSHQSKGSFGTISADVPSHGTAMFRITPAALADVPASLDITPAASNANLEAGKTVSYSITIYNSGVKNIQDASVSLQVPNGWTVAPTSANRFNNIAIGESVTASWNIAAPSTSVGSQDIGITLNYLDGSITRQQQESLKVVVNFSDGSAYLSDLAWVSSTNGWGPVEKDMSVGNNGTNDGKKITLNGVQYNKGLGTNSRSEITYNLNGKYESFISDVGIDDEVNQGSVTFQVFGDGVKLWESGLMTATSPTVTANINIKGAQILKLVVTDGGDGNAYDHGDWAGARVIAAKVPTTALSGDSSVNPGSSFTVGVSLNNVTQSVYAQDITMSYDSNVFDYVSAASANNNIQIVIEDKATAGKVRLITANTGGGISGDTTPVLNLTFKVKAGVQNTNGTIAATLTKLGVAPEGTVIQAALGSKSISVSSIEVVVDKTALTSAITNAQSLYDAAVVGTAAGQYSQAAKDAFGAALTAAKAVKDNQSATQSQVDNAVTALNSAVDAFKAAVMKSADLNKDGSINVGDLAMVAYYYGKDSTSTDWAAARIADMNNDNKIDISDLAYVASKIQ